MDAPREESLPLSPRVSPASMHDVISERGRTEKDRTNAGDEKSRERNALARRERREEKKRGETRREKEEPGEGGGGGEEGGSHRKADET